MHLDGATILSLDLSEAIVDGEVVIENSTFLGPTYFYETTFSLLTAFNRVVFKANSVQFGSNFLGGFIFCETTFAAFTQFTLLHARRGGSFLGCTFPTFVDVRSGGSLTPMRAMNFTNCKGGIFRINHTSFDEGVEFVEFDFKGVKIDNTLVHKGTVSEANLPEGFNLESQDNSDYDALTVRIGDYNLTLGITEMPLWATDAW